jgi:hypothetical protein
VVVVALAIIPMEMVVQVAVAVPALDKMAAEILAAVGVESEVMAVAEL